MSSKTSKFLKVSRKNIKKWTVFIYANGNNELEPEVYERFLQLLKEPIKDNVNIIVQIGRAPKYLVKTLRQNISFDLHEEWHGVRRYKVKYKKAIKLEDLNNINMADPDSFVDFITWGMKNYPASKNMIIISGHGAGFVGVMTDYTQDYPYMMSIDGLTNSLYKIKNNTGQSIDCMVLDACYMNMIEVWHEIALIPNKPVKYLLVPNKNVALEGLPYYLIIRFLQKYNFSFFLKVYKTLYCITESFNSIYGTYNKLLLVKLNKNCFKQLKKEVDFIGDFIFKNNMNLRKELNKWFYNTSKDPLISMLYLEDIFNKRSFNKVNLKRNLKKIIIYPELIEISQSSNEGPSLYLPVLPQQYFNVKYYYDNLLFTENNRWLTVIGGEEKITLRLRNKEKQYNIMPQPMKIPFIYVVATILDQNPGLTLEEAWNLLKEIGWYEKTYK